MAATVKNQDILNVLAKLGYNLPGPFDPTGAQHGDFKNRVMFALESVRGDKNVTDIFDQAESAAIKLKAIPANASPQEKLATALSAYGVSGHQMNLILLEAQHLRDTQPGIYQPGSKFSPDQYAQAAANIVGNTAPVKAAFGDAGVQAPAPAPGSQGEQVTPPAPAAPAAPTGPGGVTMGTKVSRATPGVAAKGTTPGVPKPPPGAAPPPPGPTTDATGRVVDKGLPPNATDAQVEDYFRKNYGADVWMAGIPDFKDIMKKVATDPAGWSLSSVTSAVQSTPWWQQNGINVQKFLEDQANDPTGTFKTKLNAHIATIKEQMATYGITLSDDRITQIATEAYKWNWDPATVAQNVSNEFHYQTGQHTVFVDKLSKDAKNYLVPLSDNTIQQWGQKLIANPAEQGNWTEFLKEQAKGMFPAFASRLDGNETMMDIASPYAKTAAQYLELDENDILNNMTDPKWMTALDTVDDKGVHKSLSPADWITKIKNDSVYRYDFTEQAKQGAAGMATDILKKFGAVA